MKILPLKKSQDPTFLEVVSLSSNFGLTSIKNLQTHEITSKVTGQDPIFYDLADKTQPLINQIMCFQSMRSKPKLIFNPN